jgi:AcrR family transcriptional regulator
MTESEPRPSRQPLAQTRTHATETGRVNQKLRTRRALIDAAKELVAAGGRPTLADVADRARVSKTTAYRYFASADDLIAEAYFDSDFPTVEHVLGGAADDPAARVLAVEQAVNDVLLAHERAMRVIVRNAIDLTLADTGDGAMRFGRRRSLIDAALQPLEGRLGPDQLDRLRHALALVIGPEAILAARDVCGLDADATRQVTGWAAQALVTRALADIS